MRGALLLAALCASVALAEGDPFGFMPDGGRGLLDRAYPDPAERGGALGRTLDAAGREAEIAARAPDLSDRETRTLATWLATVAPWPPDEPLPADGRDLALAQCQSCHSLFAGYLMQRRTREGWLSIFASPFHRDLAMTGAEREIFADYSALNMPMRVEDVPPELRF